MRRLIFNTVYRVGYLQSAVRGLVKAVSHEVRITSWQPSIRLIQSKPWNERSI